MKTKDNVVRIGGDVPTNDAADAVEFSRPYHIALGVRGDASLLFHRYSPDEVEAKKKAKKNSEAKKTDNVESYVYRDANGFLSVPGEYIRRAAILAAKSHQDPRSPRKSACDLVTAGLACLTELAPLNVKDWDYLDQRRVVVQRNAVTRTRPAMLPGWQLHFDFMVMTPEYLSPSLLHSIFVDAGRLVGIGDFRPTYGRFAVTNFEVIQLD